MRQHSHTALIILAAGSGTRFRHMTPKQYLRLGHGPVFVHATRPFFDACGKTLGHIVIASPEAFVARTRREIKRYLPDSIPISVIVGGRRRIDSIFKGIERVLQDTTIRTLLVHDAVRPLVHPDDIRGLVRAFVKGGWDAGVLGKPLAESLFEKRGKFVRGINRGKYCFGETPFIYTRKVAEEMYKKWHAKTGALHDSLDLTELISRDGRHVTGSHEARHPNIKLTYPLDAFIIKKYAAKAKHSNSYRPL